MPANTADGMTVNSEPPLINKVKFSPKNLLIFLILGLGLIAALLLVRERTRPSPKAAQAPVVFHFVPTTTRLPPDQTVVLWLNAGTFPPLPTPTGGGTSQPNGVSFVDVELDFNPAKVQLTSEIAIPTANPLQTIAVKTTMAQANSTGHISLALGLPYVTPPNPIIPATGDFQLAQFSFHVTSATVGDSVVFSTSATGIQVVDLAPVNLAYTGTSITMTLNQPTNTPTPRPTNTPTPVPPTNTPTPRPTNTPTPVPPTNTPTPRPTNTPTPVPPTNTPTPRPTNTPTPVPATNTPTPRPTNTPTPVPPTPTPTRVPPTATITPWPLLAGDANDDHTVDGFDYIIWLNMYGQTTTKGHTDGDFDTNGKVDGLDYVIWLLHYGQSN